MDEGDGLNTMVINNNTVEQINVALLDLENRIKSISLDINTLKSLQSDINNIKSNLNDINGDKIDTTYQKIADKNSVAGYVHCDKTANGTYILKATVANGNVTYAWVQET